MAGWRFQRGSVYQNKAKTVWLGNYAEYVLARRRSRTSPKTENPIPLIIVRGQFNKMIVLLHSARLVRPIQGIYAACYERRARREVAFRGSLPEFELPQDWRR
ncbi:MAG: hypothetical protein WB630_17265, partial [Candidatus Acidiferrales bacterium]